MKRALSILTACVMLLCAAVPAFAANEEIPLITVGGYASSQLYDYSGDEPQQVWPFDPQAALKQTASDLPNFTISLLKFLCGSPEPLGNAIADGGMKILEKMFCNEDGSSVYNVTHYPNDPALTNYKYLTDSGRLDLVREKNLSAAAAERIGGENVFSFQYDFRMGGYDIANEMNDYVNSVLKYTGAKRVNIFGMSYGGFVVGAYLSLFADCAPINNAVLDVPALGGTSFAERFFLGKVDFPVGSLVSLGENVIGRETNLAPLFEGVRLRRTQALVSAFLKRISVLPLHWGSLWDLLTPESYERLKPVMLDGEASAELIRKSDVIHHEIMPNYRSSFLRCMERGANVSIICNYVDYTAFGGDRLADMLLDASQVSGAICPSVGKRFPRGYSAVRTVCTDSKHDHVAPSMKIDASSAYLPENTWFVDGQYHGTYTQDPNTFALIERLLFADGRTDVYSFAEFPQFEVAQAPYYSVNAVFKGEQAGHTGDSDTLVITNLSPSRSVLITGVSMPGVKFSKPSGRLLKPGESAEIKVISAKPLDGRAELKVSYLKPVFGKSAAVRSFDFVK